MAAVATRFCRRSHIMTTRRRTVAALLASAAVLVAVPPGVSAQTTTPRAEAPAIDSKALLRALEDAFVTVADKVTPAVVNVSVKAKRAAGPQAPGGGDPSDQEKRFRGFFERFFG